MNKTQEAIKLVESGMTQYAAAKEMMLNRATLSRAIKARNEKLLKQGICPTCGQKLPEQPK